MYTPLLIFEDFRIQFGAFMNSAGMNILQYGFGIHMIHCCVYLVLELLDHRVYLYSSLVKIVKTVLQSSCTHLYS